VNDKKKLLLLAVVALGIFLRFFQIEERLVFHGEIGHNYLAIKNFIEAEQIPLLGPPNLPPLALIRSTFLLDFYSNFGFGKLQPTIRRIFFWDCWGFGDIG